MSMKIREIFKLNECDKIVKSINTFQKFEKS